MAQFRVTSTGQQRCLYSRCFSIRACSVAQRGAQPNFMVTEQQQQQQQQLQQLQQQQWGVLHDAHGHPQLSENKDIPHSFPHVCAVMGVSERDWVQVIELWRQMPDKVIPGFGVHPWYAHHHAIEGLSLVHRTPGDQDAVVNSTVVNSTSCTSATASRPAEQSRDRTQTDYQTNLPFHQAGRRQPAAFELEQGGPSTPGSSFLHVGDTDKPANQSQGSRGSDTSSGAGWQQGLKGGDENQCCCGSHSKSRLAMSESLPPPSSTWLKTMRKLLQRHPGAIVGECGLDRASHIPGTKAKVSIGHQVHLLRLQLSLAAEFQRPISLHCVQASGPMSELLASMPPSGLPDRIMMHSFGGSPESITQLCKLPNGVGSRMWFSFSNRTKTQGNEDSSTKTPRKAELGNGQQQEGSHINTSSGARKLLARIKVVPDDRLLIESDESSFSHIPPALESALGAIAAAKGWQLEKAAQIVSGNFNRFYEGYLPMC